MPSDKANSRNDKLKWWLAGVVAGMVGWYLVRLTDRIDALADAVTNLRVVLERLAP